MAFYEDIVSENSETICILCKTTLPDNDKYIEAHINQEMHKDLFIKRLTIQNNIIKINQNQYKCFVCKHIIGDMSNLVKHIQSTIHLDTMASIRTIIKKDGQLIKLPESVKDNATSVYCFICDRNEEFNLDSIKDHINSARHKRARSIIVQPLNGIFSVEGNNDDLWCKVCQVYFENYVEIILEHVDEDPEHVRRLGKILMLINGHNIVIDKYLTDPKEDKASCQKCKIDVSCNVDNLERHIKGRKHISNL